MLCFISVLFDIQPRTMNAVVGVWFVMQSLNLGTLSLQLISSVKTLSNQLQTFVRG